MSRRKACTRRCSSYLRETRHQSSYSKRENRGSPLPTSQTFSTRIGSKLAASTSACVSSPSFSSPSFFSSVFFLPSFLNFSSWSMTFFHSACFFFHSISVFCHSAQVSLNHFDGWRSSTRWVTLRFSTHSLRWSDAPAADCHSYRTSSKPSSSAGRLNLAKAFARSAGSRSGRSRLRKTVFFSSSVSSTCGGPSSFSISSSSFFSSSSLTSSLACSSSFFSSGFSTSIAAPSSALTSSFASAASPSAAPSSPLAFFSASSFAFFSASFFF
mmetsp:Transcript_77888/g.241418  ORF Transcript_77888/g.241418 Transcript_77888/m.241418 type:complete len:270 (+) Transcript_77888:264-1073(+)